MLTAAQARRVAIAATGLAERRPAGKIDVRHLRKVVQRVGIVQLDSVNAVARAHELLFFSRLGPFDSKLLHDLVYKRRELYEAWLHVASLVPTELWPMLGWRRTRSRNEWRIEDGSPVLEEVRATLRERGALAPSDLEHLNQGRGSWWGWSEGKRAFEALFASGDVGVTTRRRAFERVYDLIERVIPADVLAAPEVPEPESRRRLLLLAAHSLGVGTIADLADYHRQLTTKVMPVVSDLVADGALLELEVDGWKDKAYALPTITVPRKACPDGRLLSPFDPLVWSRPRTERLFDFHYRIEIYVPEPKRVYGYYVLPFLQGDRISARVDVRSDRKAGVLRVPGAYAEPGEDPDEVAAVLLGELTLLAAWQGCEEVVVGRKGDVAPALRRLLA